jgi:polar amino acid transport system substrate-binding protein
VIGEELALRGHQLEPRYFPLARVPLSFRKGEVGAAMTDLGQDLTAAGGNYGNPAVIYSNVFVSLFSRHLDIKKPEDLKGLSIVAFPGAIQRYPEWLAASKADGLYFEQNNQELQVLGLNRGRYDLVLSDRSIYRYFELLLERTTLFEAKSIAIHDFVEEDPQNYRALFRDPQIRDDFNAGLEQLKASGRYQAIYDHYLKPSESPISAPEKKHPHPDTPGTADDKPPTARR